MSGDMPDLPAMPDDGDPGGLRKWAEKVQAQNKLLRDVGSENAAELEALRKARAFDKAGIPEDKWGELVREKYDGDMDPDSIKSAAKALAEKYGLQIEQPTADTAPAPQATEQQADPIAMEREALAGMSQVRTQFAQPPVEQSSALVEALSKVEPGDRSTMLKLLQEANVLTTSD